MANTKKFENGRGISPREATLVNALEAAVRVGLSRSNMKVHKYVYDDLYSAAVDWVEKEALAKYLEKLNGRGIDPSEVANNIVEELFWQKLDYIMSTPDPVACRGLIINTVRFRVFDKINSDKRSQNDIDFTKTDDDESRDASDELVCSTSNVHFTDVGWNLVAANQNLEQEAIWREECLSVLKALKRNSNMFEVVSFLGTKLVGHKAGEIAAEMIAHGKAAVYGAVLRETCKMLSLRHDFFGDAAFDIGSPEVTYDEVKKLSSEVSHASDRAKNKVRKLLLR